MRYDFESLGLKTRDGTEILQGVSGTIKPGRLTGIMGPSGAGKTSFMNVLMGKVKKTSGKMLLNGNTCDMGKFKKVIGFVV